MRVLIVDCRAGYTPNDYSESGVEWRARELIEQSGCVAVPTIGQQLCGLKKVQQVLAEPGQTERFLDGTCLRLSLSWSVYNNDVCVRV